MQLKSKKIIYSIYFVITFISYCQILHFPYFKKYNSDIIENMQEYFLTFYCKGFSTNVYYFGDLITTKDKIDIFIGNHFNFIDFIIHQGIFKKLDSKEITYLYSKYIDNIPIIGRGFKNSNSLALNKKIHLDIDNIRDYINNKNNIVIYLNPEGTRITYKKLISSKKYSRDNNLKEYSNLLFPKMKGLYTLINELSKQGKMGNIIDFTVKVENTTKNDNDLYKYLNKPLGNTYVMIKTYKVKHIVEYDKFKEWFLMIWDKKEEYLNDYNNTEKYDYKLLDTKLKTSIKVITCLTIYIFTYFIYFLYLKKNSLFNIRTIIG